MEKIKTTKSNPIQINPKPMNFIFVKKPEFSKLLVAFISLNYLAALIAGLVSVIVGDQPLADLLAFAGGPFASVTALYLVKSAAENREKIKSLGFSAQGEDETA